MDIAKYIGQFLVKNNFCYIHGLGNLELVKRAAYQEGGNIQAPSYEVVVTAGGSIDDSFANFIATNEQISISKAANALREYSMQSRKDMQAGKEVLVPGLGKFIEEGGKVKFVTDPHFRHTPAGIPVLKNSKQLEEQKVTPPHVPSFPPPAKANSINWSMVVLVIVLLLILGGGGYGYYYYQSQQKQNKPVDTSIVNVPDTVIAPPVAPTPVDTAKKDTVVAAPAIDTNAMSVYKMVIGEYPNRERAEKRYRQLKINGNKVEVVTKDSLTFKVVAEVNCRVVDTLKAIDSLQKLFGFKNTGIYR